MVERLFIGWRMPALRETANILADRYAQVGQWDMRSLLLVIPGGQARRRLIRLICDTAAERKLQASLPEIVTPANLAEHLYKTELPIATPMQSSFAWIQVISGISKDDTKILMPSAGNSGTTAARAALAEEARLLHEAAAAEGMTIQAVTDACHEASSPGDLKCLAALARLEQGYLAALTNAGLVDRDQANRDALATDSVSCDRAIFLVGAQDLSGILCQLLRRLKSPVFALIPAPKAESDGFDDIGCLKPDAWREKPIPIPDEALSFVNGPADEAERLRDIIAALDGRYAREEITVGVGDEDNAASLSRRLAALDLPVHSPFGPSLRQSRPGALLSAIRDYLMKRTVRNFAVLARHPDLETWLEDALAQRYQSPAPDANSDLQSEEFSSQIADKPLISVLDCYIAKCLPETLPQTVRPDRIEMPCRSKADFAKHKILAARDIVEGLLAPLALPDQAMPRWAEPIADILRAVYGAEPIDDKALEHALEVLADALSALKHLSPSLAPKASSAEALGALLKNAGAPHFSSNELESGSEMMGWLELALDDAPVLLLTGLHEGSVPASIGDDPLLPDSLRQKLGLPHDGRRYARDAFLLRVMLESRENVHIVVTRRGIDGNPEMPSRLLFACDGETAARRAQQYAKGQSDSPPPASIFAAGTERRLPPPRPEPPVETLSSLSITAFRDYLACPYRFYLCHVLELECEDDSAGEMDNRLFGTMIHSCLKAFARSTAAYSTDVEQIQAFLRDELLREARRRFGAAMLPALHLQIRQAGRRLDAFSEWQAQTIRDGWRIQREFSERELTASILIDETPFEIRGRLDRVDRSDSGAYRIIDYKTGDKLKSPEDAHRAKSRDMPEPQWKDLQLPLYRRLLAENGTVVAPDGLGYVALSADLSPITISERGRVTGGIGYLGANWDADDIESAIACAEGVIRKIRQGIFWPPTDPPTVRAEWRDPFSSICLDSCRNRAEWLGSRGDRP